MSYTDDEVAEEVDDMPSSLKEGTEDDDTVIEGESLSAEQSEFSDVIEPAKGVEMIIHSVTVDKYVPQGETEWQKISLRPRLVVAEKGTDGKGRYKNKNLFPRITVSVNRDAYPEKFRKDWWQPPAGGAYGDYTAFLQALGFPTNPAPRNDKAFRDSLKGRRIIVDITKKRREVYDQQAKKYVKTEEYENELFYRGQPKAAPKPDVAEAAQA
jgi:hypothetical protein